MTTATALLNTRDLRLSEATQVVTAGEFKKLMVSHRRLIRADEPVQHMRGLRDLDSGELFLVEERKLLEAARN